MKKAIIYKIDFGDIHVACFMWEPEFANLQLQDLEITSLVGTGQFSMVFLTQIKGKPDMSYVVKRIKKCDVREYRQQLVWNERRVLIDALRAKCNFIVKLYRTFKDENYVYFLLENCQGGELFGLIAEKYRRGVPEKFARFYVACIIKAYEFLHSMNIAYRDLKPENVMMDGKGYLKLVDFGYATLLKPGEKRHSPVGTPEYLPPEMVTLKGTGETRNYEIGSDFWQLGMLTYELLHGDTAFLVYDDKGDVDTIKTRQRIRLGINTVKFKKSVSKQAKDFILSLCRYNPEERLGNIPGQGYSGIMAHNWFDDFDWDALTNRTMPAPIKPIIKGPMDTTYFQSEPLSHLLREPEADTTGWDEHF